MVGNFFSPCSFKAIRDVPIKSQIAEIYIDDHLYQILQTVLNQGHWNLEKLYDKRENALWVSN